MIKLLKQVVRFLIEVTPTQIKAMKVKSIGSKIWGKLVTPVARSKISQLFTKMTALPIECWGEIFKNIVDIRDLIALMKVNKSFNSVLKEDAYWKQLFLHHRDNNWKYLVPLMHDQEYSQPSKGDYKNYGLRAEDAKMLIERDSLPFYEQFKLYYR